MRFLPYVDFLLKSWLYWLTPDTNFKYYRKADNGFIFYANRLPNFWCGKDSNFPLRFCWHLLISLNAWEHLAIRIRRGNTVLHLSNNECSCQTIFPRGNRNGVVAGTAIIYRSVKKFLYYSRKVSTQLVWWWQLIKCFSWEESVFQ